MANEYDDLEAEAEAFLGENPDHSAAALIKNLRKWGKTAEKRGREAAQAEYAAQQARDRAFAKIPEAVRPLFNGIDPTDAKAIQAQVNALKALGLKLDADSEGEPAAPAPQQQSPAPPAAVSTDPTQAAVAAMQAAAAGGTSTEPQGDLATRMQAMAANPGAFTQEQIDAVGEEYNAAVNAAARQGTSGALG
jgi:hypothetical protein